jgi:hypothetical protein
MSRPGTGEQGMSQPGTTSRVVRRWSLAIAGLMAVAVAGLAVGLGGSGGTSASGSGSSFATSTALVKRGSLSSQIQVDATLADAGSYTAVNQASGGTITWLPPVGRTVRQGQPLYRVNGLPVVLLYGHVPSFESLSVGSEGPDVAELNADLVRLGYTSTAALGPRPGWDYFSAATASAVGLLQARLGLQLTSALPLGQAVFLPGPVLITAWATGLAPGSPAQPGMAMLSASSVTPVVTISLDASQQTDVRAGDKVVVSLPSGRPTAGTVSQVGKVATTPSADSAGSAAPTIPVTVTLADPRAVGRLNSAPVTVTITTASARNVLTVPVDALLAQPSGGYAVEVPGQDGRHRLVTVGIGLFDDAAGLVQVTGTGLRAGQRVVVPSV